MRGCIARRGNGRHTSRSAAPRTYGYELYPWHIRLGRPHTAQAGETLPPRHARDTDDGMGQHRPRRRGYEERRLRFHNKTVGQQPPARTYSHSPKPQRQKRVYTVGHAEALRAQENNRRQQRPARGARHSGTRGAHWSTCAYHRRERHRQGTARGGSAQEQPASI